MPSVFSITFAALPSMTATHEFVVPKSIPITFAMATSSSQQGPAAPGGTARNPLGMVRHIHFPFRDRGYIWRRAARYNRASASFRQLSRSANETGDRSFQRGRALIGETDGGGRPPEKRASSRRASSHFGKRLPCQGSRRQAAQVSLAITILSINNCMLA